MNYYNEFDDCAADWLENLIRDGLIPAGVVDRRSISDVLPVDLFEFDQCHFFAGIGGWAHALKLAGVPSDRKLWTGSCPCQPFSSAGKGAGFADERHLWPDFHWLIDQCRPPVVFGEQVASSDGLQWLDLVSADVEASGYTFGAADLCAAGVGAPHIRQRLYWVADSNHARLEGRGVRRSERSAERAAWSGGVDVRGRDGRLRPIEPGILPLAHGLPARVGRLRGYGNAIVPQVAAEFIKAAL